MVNCQSMREGGWRQDTISVSSYNYFYIYLPSNMDIKETVILFALYEVTLMMIMTTSLLLMIMCVQQIFL